MSSIAAQRVARAAPADFVDEAVTNIGETPTDMTFTADGRLLLAAKGGKLWLFTNGSLSGAPALDLSGNICNEGERGLQSVTTDPDFGSNRYIYIYYTWNGGNGQNNCSGNAGARNRVARYVLSGNSAQSPVVILDNIPTPCSNHNGGDLAFGPDGLLYVSSGDGGCRVDNNALSGSGNDNARFRSLLSGKILRITRDGDIPSGNPYAASAGAVRCGDTGPDKNGGFCRETYAWGLRNPWKIAFKPGTSQFVINDVGQSAFEEINAGAINADYGWNTREGSCPLGQTSGCSGPPAGMTDPLYAYSHVNGECAIVGGAYSTGAWPAPYNDSYFFADYCGDAIYHLSGTGGNIQRNVFHTKSSAGQLIDLMFDPGSASLYYSLSSGAIRRVRNLGQSSGTARFTSRVLIDGTRAPLPGWTVNARNLSTGATRSASTDGNGAATLDIPPGPYTFCATVQAGWAAVSPDSACYWISLNAGQSVDLSFTNRQQAGAGARFSTRTIVDGTGAPISGWAVIARNLNSGVESRATSDADGLTRIDVAAGSYLVCSAVPAGWEPVSPALACYWISVNAGDDANLTFRARQQAGDARIGARVLVDGSNAPLAGWSVVADNSTTGQNFSGTTDSAGAVLLDVSAGSYRICVTLQGGASGALPDSGCYWITLSGGSLINLAFTVRQTSSQARFTGRVRASDGAALQGWTLSARNLSNGQTQSSQTDAQGTTTIDLAAGSYALCESVQPGWIATSPGSACYWISLGAGQTIDLTYTNQRN